MQIKICTKIIFNNDENLISPSLQSFHSLALCVTCFRDSNSTKYFYPQYIIVSIQVVRTIKATAHNNAISLTLNNCNHLGKLRACKTSGYFVLKE